MSPRVEFRTPWRKSSFSAEDSNCIEVAHAAEVMGVRDSKNANGSVLVFTTGSWSRLVDHVSQ